MSTGRAKERDFEFYKSPRTDAMYARLALLPLILLFTVWVNKAMASEWFCDFGVAPGADAIYKALEPAGDNNYWDRPCHDKTCLAIRDLECAYGAVGHRDVPNTMGVGNAALSAQFLRTFNATIYNLGRTHPERRPLYCGFLTKIALLNFSYEDNYFDNQTIELATRITRPHFDCIGPVMAALPHTE